MLNQTLRTMTLSSGSLIFAAILCILFFGPTQTVMADSLMDEARALMDTKQAGDAYKLLEAQQEERAGEVDYDYLLGLAAIDSGHYPEAILALERILTVQPDHTQARAELARVYFIIGENRAAQLEFRSVIEQEPPESVMRSISRYLNAIEQRFDEEQQQLSGFIDFGTGFDSNVNNATADDSVAVPRLGGLRLILDPMSKEQADGFLNLHGGVNFSRKLSSKRHFLLGGTVGFRDNFEQDTFDNMVGDVFTGVRFFEGKDRFTLALQGQGFWVNGNKNRNLIGSTAQWNRVASARVQTSTYLQYAEITYPGQSVRDVDQLSAGFAWVRGLKMSGSPTLYLGAYGGQETEKDALREDIGRVFLGLRAGGSIGVNEKDTMGLALHYIDSQYGADDPIFLVTRKDQYLDLTFKYTHRLSPLWRLEPQLRYSKNQSNISINDATRYQLLLVARHDFH